MSEEKTAKKRKYESKTRAYMLTVQEPTPEKKQYLKEHQGLKYQAWQEEVAPTTGKDHLQAYLIFNSPRTLTSVAREFWNSHVDPRKGTHEQALAYVTKAESRKEGGEQYIAGDPPEPGKRNDIQACKKVILETNSMRAVCMEATSYQGIRVAQAMLTFMRPPRRNDITVHWFWGPTGCSKSHTAEAEAESKYPDKWYRCNRNGKWWDGYDGEPAVIIDDYRRDFCKFHELLQLLDKYSLRVEYKGGYRPILATEIWITAPKDPLAMWQGRTEEELDQLIRRISDVRHMNVKWNGGVEQRSGVILTPTSNILDECPLGGY